MSYFTYVSPESAGIASQGIEDFLKTTEEAGLELHRLMLLRYGKCCAKIIWEPYEEEDLHPVYSFSKSLTATAIGFARQEGLLSLDEKIADIFPKDLPAEPDENLLACTIHDLLCMSCGQETEAMDFSASWRKVFFAHPFPHKPGTFYKYNTAGTNILASVIRKKTGMQVTEYLKDRLFIPLGMSEVYCAALPDDLHTQIGGAGMKMNLENMAKFTQFMLQDGVWDGKPLLQDWFFARAGVKQIETEGDSEGHVKEWALGYGYQCWMCALPGSFRADGAFGQFGLVYPTLDLCIIINAATEQTQTIIDAVNHCLLPKVSGSDTKKEDVLSGTSVKKYKKTSEKRSEDTDLGEAMIRTYSLPVLVSCKNPVFEEVLNQSVYQVESGKRMCGIQELVGGAGLFDIDRSSSISEIGFSFGEHTLTLIFTENGQKKELAAGINGKFACSVIDGITYAACARWRSLRRLELEIRRRDAMSGVRLILTFVEDRLRFEADETLMTDGGLGMTERHLEDFFLA